MHLRLLAVALTGAALSSGCSSSSCDALPGMLAERDAARQAYVEQVRSGALSDVESEQADEQLHALEARVATVEQECAGR